MPARSPQPLAIAAALAAFILPVTHAEHGGLQDFRQTTGHWYSLAHPPVPNKTIDITWGEDDSAAYFILEAAERKTPRKVTTATGEITPIDKIPAEKKRTAPPAPRSQPSRWANGANSCSKSTASTYPDGHEKPPSHNPRSEEQTRANAGMNKRRRGDRMAHAAPPHASDGLGQDAKPPVAPDPTRSKVMTPGRTMAQRYFAPAAKPRARTPGRQAKGAGRETGKPAKRHPVVATTRTRFHPFKPQRPNRRKDPKSDRPENRILRSGTISCVQKLTLQKTKKTLDPL